MTGSPIKGKPFDKDALFAKMVKYYMEKKNYTVDEANRVAQSIVQQQIDKRKNT